ncbi:uncharacterized protein P884DRAFT_271919 [Thermothelomyces heterothallicus CBS 202.75]|uniref:uncharacterized protein n=1 Tax=Thermothelomyces heterothallicus CBS 202.75 TaxID=1149848 RepID=UPI003743AF3E
MASAESFARAPAADRVDCSAAPSLLPGLEDPFYDWPPVKSCLKSSGRQGRSVRFADAARCLESGAVVEPHPTTRDEWMDELLDARIDEADSSGRSTPERIEAIEAVVHPRVRELVRWQSRRRVHRQLLPADFDRESLEAYAWRLLFQRAHKHMLRNRADCPIRSRLERHKHPALSTRPDPEPAPPAVEHAKPVEASAFVLPLPGGLPGGIPPIPSEFLHLFSP